MVIVELGSFTLHFCGGKKCSRHFFFLLSKMLFKFFPSFFPSFLPTFFLPDFLSFLYACLLVCPLTRLLACLLVHLHFEFVTQLSLYCATNSFVTVALFSYPFVVILTRDCFVFANPFICTISNFSSCFLSFMLSPFHFFFFFFFFFSCLSEV